MSFLGRQGGLLVGPVYSRGNRAHSASAPALEVSGPMVFRKQIKSLDELELGQDGWTSRSLP